jgi:Tfp pilus assembly protein PilZ
MSEPVQLAKAAREQLAAALNALQTSNVPDELVDAAEPVAQAMGVLHRIERTNGENLDGRAEALEAVRTALNRVQRVDSDHPAVERVMEAIAASLSSVHALARYRPPIAAEPATQALPVTAPPMTPPVSAPQYAAPPQPAYAAPPPPAYAAPPQPAPRAAQVMASTMPSAQSQPQGAVQPNPAASRAIPADRPSQSGGTSKVDVELGIHSTSNFYKGLGGNDVIEHGGLFVATYKVLKINTPVTLRVLLPGDYEFTASAVVQWTREAGSTEPGYGARFTQISQEARQLVYRYTRNREPMFYDDL